MLSMSVSRSGFFHQESDGDCSARCCRLSDCCLQCTCVVTAPRCRCPYERHSLHNATARNDTDTCSRAPCRSSPSSRGSRCPGRLGCRTGGERGSHDTVWPFRFNVAPPITFSTPMRSGISVVARLGGHLRTRQVPIEHIGAPGPENRVALDLGLGITGTQQDGPAPRGRGRRRTHSGDGRRSLTGPPGCGFEMVRHHAEYNFGAIEAFPSLSRGLKGTMHAENRKENPHSG